MRILMKLARGSTRGNAFIQPSNREYLRFWALRKTGLDFLNQ